MAKLDKFAGEYAAGRERGVPDDVKKWIDDKVHTAGKTMYRGLLQLLASGFGKGLLATAGVLVIGITAATVAGIPIPIAGAVMGPTVAQSVETGLMAAGNFLLGSDMGVGLLAFGGMFGAVVETQREYAKMNADMANRESKRYETLRHQQAAQPLAPMVEQHTAKPLDNQLSHCAQLMEKRAHEQQTQRGTV